VAGLQVPPAVDTLFVPKDTFRLTVNAEHDRKLLWVGYRLGQPVSRQDSVHAVAQSGAGFFELDMPIPATWLGDSPLTVFARDALSRATSSRPACCASSISFRRPLGIVTLDGLATDVEYDARRNRVYLLESQEGRIDVLDLAGLSLSTPISVPTTLPSSVGAGIDLSPGGDSLIVAITVPPTLHLMIDLVSGSRSDVPIEDPGSEVLFDVTVTGGRAFAYGERRDEMHSITGRLWEVNLGTGAQQMSTDVGASGGGNLGQSTGFATSADGSHLLLVDTPVPCIQVFTPATGFGPCGAPPGELAFLPSGSSDGSAWLVRHLLYDSGLAVAGTPVPQGTPAGVIGSDGSVAYYPTPLGFDVVELPSGTVREHVRVPNAVTRLMLLPEAGRILAWTPLHQVGDFLHLDRLTLVDLQ
jgi:hypothetical protein